MLSQLFTAGDHLLPEDAAIFESAGFTPWADTQQDPFLFSSNDQEPEPVFSNTGSDNSDINVSTPETKSSGEVTAVDERKLRRMISNRESARRSRMRKQKHLENLKSQSHRLKIGNRDLMNRLRVVNFYGKLLRQDNERLVSESVMLERKLRGIRLALHVRQTQQQYLVPSSAWPCNNNVTYIYEQNPPSLIT